MNLYYKRDGTPYENDDVLLWAKDHGELKNRIVKQETLKNGFFVSTVWLGLDHSLGIRKPLIFETMVFKTKDDWGDLDMDRYSTEEEALEGHEKMVEKWSKK